MQYSCRLFIMVIGLVEKLTLWPAWDLAHVIAKDDAGWYGDGRLPAKTGLNFIQPVQLMSKCQRKAVSK